MQRHRSSRRRTPGWSLAIRYTLIGLAAVFLLFGFQIVRLYTDAQWFAELGRSQVFWTVLGAKLKLFFGFGLVFFLFAYLNLWVARHLNAGTPSPVLLDPEREQLRLIARRAMGWLTLGGSLVLAFLVAGNAATHWPDYLLFTQSASFGQTDPVFKRDIGLYVFKLPFLQYLQGWALLTLVLTTLAVGAVYFTEGGVQYLVSAKAAIPEHVRRHTLALAAGAAFVHAWGLYLGRYEFLFSTNRANFGAAYTDIHARIPAAVVQAAVMALVGVLCLVNTRVGRPFRLPVVGLAAYLLGAVLLQGAWPGVMQRFTVTPNEGAKEEPYISRDIAFTRRAYALDKVKQGNLPGERPLTARELSNNRATINNIRLWDWPQLGAVYSAKQALAAYYRFTLPYDVNSAGSNVNIDVDRYVIGGKHRQVMLAAREFNPEGLPPQANTWINRHMQFTHGYGVVMSPVNEVDPDGLPIYYLGDIPVRSTRPELRVDQPGIYFGETTDDYVFVGTRRAEFDYTSSTGNRTTTYSGKGGVRIGSSTPRLAWSIRLGDANILFTSDITANSRILFRRNIRERVRQVAPFLNWDNDPYIVVHNGRLIWFMDGYTVTDRYPYSRPTTVAAGVSGVGQRFNYIRNSVKATIDAYDGTVTLYVADPEDPMAKAWGGIFPGLLRPMEEMPDGLRAHVRYPEDLFRIQRDVYTVYHVTDPGTYYRGEDQWEVARDPTQQFDGDTFAPTSNNAPRMIPYFVNMRLPGEDEEEFIMMSPFTPLERQNTSGWMCARSDPEHYGQLLVYRFPRERNVNGPQQIMAQIRATPDVSRYQTLMGQRGSSVIYGNLLVIPLAGSLLYAAPLYVQSTEGQAIPRIQQVVVASGDLVVMRPTLSEAVSVLGKGEAAVQRSEPDPLTGDRPPETSAATPPTTGPATVDQLVDRANAAYTRARERQRQYNESLDELGRALDALQKGVKPPP